MAKDDKNNTSSRMPDIPEDAQEALQEYAAALASEFERSTRNDDVSEVEQKTKDFFRAHAHDAAAQIVLLSNTAHTEGVRLNASKYIIDQAINDANKDNDPIKELLAELSAQKGPKIKKATPTE